MVSSKSAGGFLGGITNNLGFVGIAVALGALVIFRKDITNFLDKGFKDLVSINLGDVNLPEIKLPSFDFGNIFGTDNSSSIAGETVPFGDDGTTVTIPADNIVNPDGTVSGSPPILNLDDQSRQQALDQLEINRLRSMLENALADIPASEDISGSEFASARNADEFQRRLDEQANQNIINPPETTLIVDESSMFGGGESFIGGTTTFGDNIIDTFGEVLNIFPNLRASEISNLLRENVGLTGTEFAQINPLGETNIFNAGGEQQQSFNNASDGSGLTPEQIIQNILGGNINNF